MTRDESPAILDGIIHKHQIIFKHEMIVKLARQAGDTNRVERYQREITRLKQEIRDDFSLLRRRARDDGYRAHSRALTDAGDVAEAQLRARMKKTRGHSEDCPSLRGGECAYPCYMQPTSKRGAR